MSYSVSPRNLGNVLRQLDAVRPVVANADELAANLFGLCRKSDFAATMIDGTVIQFPPSIGIEVIESTLPLMISETWVNRVYSPPGFEITDGSTVIDIGANIGVFSLFAARQNPSGTVFAFEPVPALYDLLLRNLKTNHVVNVHARNVGVLDRTCHDTIWLHPKNAGGHSVFRDNGSTLGPHGVDAAFFSLDDVITLVGVKEVDLLKVDCEGSEYRVFLGCSDAALERVHRIAMEYHPVSRTPNDPNLIKARLLRLGFSVHVEVTGRGVGMIYGMKGR